MTDGTITDAEFVRAFLSGAIPNARFHHRDHLRLAWSMIRERGAAAAANDIASAIRHVAAQHGHPEKYHETITQFWVRIVAHMLAARPDLTTFAEFLDTFPQLLDQNLPYHHWRRDTMWSAPARARWVEPDLLPLPA